MEYGSWGYIESSKPMNIFKSETAIVDVLQKKFFLKISQYLQENNCVGVCF